MFCFKIFFILCSSFLYRVQSFLIYTTHVENITEKKFYNLNEAEELFKEFIESLNKEYKNDEEYNYRLEVFKNNLEDINEINRKAVGEVYGITPFSDLTDEEFLSQHTGLEDVNLLKNVTKLKLKLAAPMSSIPDSWDWRTKGVVSEVRDQGRCLACWAFSAVGCVEGQYAKKHGKLYSLSDQQMLDCFQGWAGCKIGNSPYLAFEEAKRLGGYMLAKDYPYRDNQGQCQFQKNKVVVQVKEAQLYQVKNEEHLRNLLYTYGPVSIGISAGPRFKKYSGGIAKASTLGCPLNSKSNHAVLLVGYGTKNGVPYWIIKNSWGTSWGEKGFMRLARGSNTCNILRYAATVDVL